MNSTRLNIMHGIAYLAAIACSSAYAESGIYGYGVNEGGDVKLYSPVDCVVAGTNQSYINYSAGRALNPTSSAKPFYCPITADVLTLTGGHIYLLDTNIIYNFTCQLRSQAPTSTSYIYSSVTTSGESTTPVKKTFSSSSYYTDTNRYIYCSVPGTYEPTTDLCLIYPYECK